MVRYFVLAYNVNNPLLQCPSFDILLRTVSFDVAATHVKSSALYRIEKYPSFAGHLVNLSIFLPVAGVSSERQTQIGVNEITCV